MVNPTASLISSREALDAALSPSAAEHLRRRLSHELRQTPNALRILARRLASVPPAQQATAIAAVGAGVEELDLLVTGLVEYELHRRGFGDHDHRYANIDALLQGALAEEFTAARKAGLDIDFDARTDFLFVDVAALIFCTRKLVENAIDFTPEGSVFVSASSGEARLRVEVRDTGVSAPPAFGTALFAPYFVFGEERARRRGRAGLGLASAAEAAHAAGGEILLELRDDGVTATLVLPIGE